jgi:hypothetical protein
MENSKRKATTRKIRTEEAAKIPREQRDFEMHKWDLGRPIYTGSDPSRIPKKSDLIRLI